MFTLDNKFRRLLIRGIEWKWWDRTVLFLIFLNTIQLALYEPFDNATLRPGFHKRDVLDICGKVFSVFFTLECIAKVMALGFIVGHHTYLSDGWNYLDFFIVIVGLLDFMPMNSAGNLSALRSLRVLRPLRAITKFPELKFLVVLLLQCIPNLSNVFGICLFIFFVFGILGVQLFAGALRGRCFDIESGMAGGDICSEGGGMAECSEGTTCLLLGTNLGRGAISFDDIGSAILTIFQTMTLEGWADIMYSLQDAVSFWAFAYFVILVAIGPMMAVQLFLVVISSQYEANVEAQQLSAKDVEEIEPSKEEHAHSEPHQDKEHNVGGGTNNEAHVNGGGAGGSTVVYEARKLGEINGHGISPVVPHDESYSPQSPIERGSISQTKSSGNGGGGISRRASVETRRRKKEWDEKTMYQKFMWKTRLLAKSDSLLNFIVMIIVLNTLGMAIDHSCNFCEKEYCRKFKGSLELSNVFFAFIFVVELSIKLIGLGFMKFVSNVSNLFDAVIVISSLVEVPGIFATFSCYNEPKPCVEYFECEGGGGGLSVLRTFRLVRIVKLLRAFPDIQKQVAVLADVMKSVFALVILILIALVVFMVLGANVFGGMLVAEWDSGALTLGKQVFLQFPGDDGVMRYGRIVEMDFFNRTSTPWKVAVAYGKEEGVRGPLGLGEDGEVWACTQDEPILATPVIVGFPPRLNYDDISSSVITTFQLVTAEGWNDNLYDTVANVGGLGAIYYVCLITVGNWMLLNLFIAILITKFNQQKKLALMMNLELMQQRLLEKLGNLDEGDLASRIEELFSSIDKDNSGEIDMYEFGGALEQLEVKLSPKQLFNLVRQYDTDKSGSIDFEEFLAMIKQLLQEARVSLSSSNNLDHLEEDARKVHANKHQDDEEPTAQEELERSLFCLHAHNPFRVLCLRIAGNKLFEQFILLCIAVSTFCLAIDNPNIGEGSGLQKFLSGADLFLNIAFTFECVTKIVAFSFKRYIKSTWNRLDFLIVCTSLIDMALTMGLQGQNVDLSMLKIFRIFRVFRALRPLRIIAKARGLQVLVKTLLGAIKPAANTLAIAIAFFSVLGILGMQLLSGKMGGCSDMRISHRFDTETEEVTYLGCRGLEEDGSPRDWGSYDINFDNFWQALRSMFIIATQDNWPGHMFAGIDARSSLLGPWEGNNKAMFFFYLAAVLVSAFVVVNMFIGVFVDVYNEKCEVTPPSKPPTLVELLPVVFKDPEHGAQAYIFTLITHQNFDFFIAFFIIFNVVSMAVQSYKPSNSQTSFDLVTNYFFTYVFGCECCLKLFCLHMKRYFANGWNKFDFFIVMVSYIGICIDNIGATISLDPTILRILRIFRIFRILRAFRIFKALKGLQAIVAALARSVPGMVNLVGMLGLLFFIFGVLGVTLFGNMCIEGDQTFAGVAAVRCLFTKDDNLLSGHAHFQGVGWALLSLFRISTGDAWGDILSGLQLEAGGRQVTEETWNYLCALLLIDPSTNNIELPSYNISRFDRNLSLEIAELSVRRWNDLTQGLEGDRDWPFPSSTPEAFQWIQLARMALPSCLTDSEAFHLEEAGLADCSRDGYYISCSSSCGSALIANIYLTLFVCVSAFILLQLVIAVLMDQLTQEKELEEHSPLVPEATCLHRNILARWRRGDGKVGRRSRRIVGSKSLARRGVGERERGG